MSTTAWIAIAVVSILWLVILAAVMSSGSRADDQNEALHRLRKKDPRK